MRVMVPDLAGQTVPTTGPAKNVRHVKRSQAEKKKIFGKDKYNKINADAEHRRFTPPQGQN